MKGRPWPSRRTCKARITNVHSRYGISKAFRRTPTAFQLIVSRFLPVATATKYPETNRNAGQQR